MSVVTNRLQTTKYVDTPPTENSRWRVGRCGKNWVNYENQRTYLHENFKNNRENERRSYKRE